MKRRHRRVHATPEEGRAARIAALRRCAAARRDGSGEPTLDPRVQENVRQRAAEEVADAVSRAMAGIGHRQVGRRLGRDLGQTLRRIYQDGDPRVSTLADIAVATGHRLVISFNPIVRDRSV